MAQRRQDVGGIPSAFKAWIPVLGGLCRQIAPLLLLALAACDSRSQSASGSVPERLLETTPRVKLVKASRRDMARRVALPGTVRADSDIVLYAKVTGYLKTLLKDRGDKVRAGEVVATLEIPEMGPEIEHAQAAFEIEEATLKRLLEVREIEKSAITDQDVDLARAKRQMAKATLKKLETLLAYTELRAPFDGYVTERYVDVGAFIQQGKIMALVDAAKVRVVVDIPESEVRFATPGTQSEITVDSLPGRNVLATVSRSAGAVDPLMRTLRVEIDVPNRDLSILPGMFVRVTLGVDCHPNALVVPDQALSLEQDKAFVFVVDTLGKAKKLEVTTGIKTSEWCEVMAGLSGDETVLLSKGIAISDGMTVRPEGGP
jgi:RND family efflux transporter MFP subunit